MPALIKGYEYDVFLSYRQKDNKYDGWVTEFVANLRKELEATFKEDISIYFDENPQDGLLETHDVDGSLKDKLKCLIFIPIISRTYCDPKSFAWKHEFVAFLKAASNDEHGLKVRLPKGNLASRVLPIRIHELDTNDKQLIEAELQGPLRSIDFTVKSAGVNRPLRQRDDESSKGGQTSYRDQINKTANAIRELVSGMQAKDQGVVYPEQAEEESQEPLRPSNLQGRKLKMPSVPSLVTLVSLAAFLTLATIHFSESSEEIRAYHTTILPPEKIRFFGANTISSALSPDGLSLAFVGTDSTGKALLYVRQLNDEKPRSLVGTEGGHLPFWSPDSHFIGFFANGKLRKINAEGGPSEVLCDATGRGGTWNRDGTIVFSSESTTPLSRISSLGGEVTSLTKFDTLRKETSHRWPSFLPDGKHFLYTSRVNTVRADEEDAIFVASLDTTETPKLISRVSSNAVYANGYLLTVKGQTLVAQPFDQERLQLSGDPTSIAEQLLYDGVISAAAFTASQNGILVYQQTLTAIKDLKLVWRDRTGKPLGAFSHGVVEYDNIRLSPDAAQVALSHANEKGDVDTWIYDFNRPLWTRFTFAKGINRWPHWSADGRTIIFTSNRNGKYNLYRRATNGSEDEELLFESDQDKFPTDWSADGRFILLQQGFFANNLVILPLNEQGVAGKPFAFLQTEFNEARGVFAPDGRSIAYQSNESGRGEVYIRPFPGPGAKLQVSTQGGQKARWRRDGKELFFISGDQVMAAEIKTGKSSMEVGTVKLLFKFTTTSGNARDLYDVTADGQKFLIESTPAQEATLPLTLMVNWPGVIRKK